MLGSYRLRRLDHSAMYTAARTVTLTTDAGVRLGGALSGRPTAGTKGLVILLHGWEGSLNSTYVLSAADVLFNQGWDVFRLNLRDHGHTHHLNPGLFYATLLDETYAGVMMAARLRPDAPVFLAGFSLGGNFALRIARQWSASPETDIDLRRVVAVSPVLDPARATDAIDRHRMIRLYFMRKWRRSLTVKARCFPEHYDFTAVTALPTIRRMTEVLLQQYTDYRCADEYFAAYGLPWDSLRTIRVPTTIITAKDDPIIPVDDFYRLALNRQIRLLIQPHGGHNGFVRDLRGYRWYEDFMAALFHDAQTPSAGTDL